MAGKTDYKNKFNTQNYDRINLVVPKGKKADLQEHAQAKGESLNGFINNAIDNQVKMDKANKRD